MITEESRVHAKIGRSSQRCLRRMVRRGRLIGGNAAACLECEVGAQVAVWATPLQLRAYSTYQLQRWIVAARFLHRMQDREGKILIEARQLLVFSLLASRGAVRQIDFLRLLDTIDGFALGSPESRVASALERSGLDGAS